MRLFLVQNVYVGNFVPETDISTERGDGTERRKQGEIGHLISAEGKVYDVREAGA